MTKYFALLTYGNMTADIAGDRQGPLTVTIGPIDTEELLSKEVKARKNIHLTKVDCYKGEHMLGERLEPATITEPEETWEHA